MSKEVIEKKIEELKSRQQDFINNIKKMQEDAILLQRNVDGCEGAIIALKEMLKDIDLEVTASEEVKA